MNAGTVATVVLALLGFLSLLAAVGTFIYRRGGSEEHWTQALKDNTTSNRELTVELRDFKAQTLDQIHGLDKRVTVLERTKS